jgi:subtilisin family serine protease
MIAATGASNFFSDKTGRGIRIAIIDSGIHAAHPHVGRVAGGIGISEDGDENGDFLDRLGHGTAVAAAIREKAPEAELYAIKVFQRSLVTRVERLVQAIDWAARHGMQLVNLSLGTGKAEHESSLRSAIDAAGRCGTRLVAACENSGTRWMPGSLDGVVPVVLDWDCPRDEYRARVTNDGRIIFGASGYPRDIPGVSRERNLKGISFAVANMTGFAARALEADPRSSLDDLVRVLGKSGTSH